MREVHGESKALLLCPPGTFSPPASSLERQVTQQRVVRTAFQARPVPGATRGCYPCRAFKRPWQVATRLGAAPAFPERPAGSKVADFSYLVSFRFTFTKQRSERVSLSQVLDSTGIIQPTPQGKADTFTGSKNSFKNQGVILLCSSFFKSVILGALKFHMDIRIGLPIPTKTSAGIG